MDVVFRVIAHGDTDVSRFAVARRVRRVITDDVTLIDVFEDDRVDAFGLFGLFQKGHPSTSHRADVRCRLLAFDKHPRVQLNPVSVLRVIGVDQGLPQSL